MVPRRIQHPITYFARSWDNVMVHGVNNLYIASSFSINSQLVEVDITQNKIRAQYITICPHPYMYVKTRL